MPSQRRLALVTGGSRGIGRAIVEALAARDWSVISVARSAQSVTSPNAAAVTADLATAEGAHSVLEAVLGRSQRLDLLVNNAGAIDEVETVLDVSEETMLRSWQLHVLSPFILTRGLAEALKSGQHPAVVNIGSIYGRIADPEVVAYGTAKAGLDYLTGVLAMALAPTIRVNAILPGHVDTDMTAGAPEEFLADVRDQTPLGRLASPQEVVDAVLFLASPEASFITGASLRVDGGFRAQP
jgi:NAD(P)-dependent dehydrogenase (short-subunit alcohol dehydrogenase family)